MHDLIKKIHMYVGLLNFSILLVFGVAGIQATLSSGEGVQRQWSEARYIPFEAPPAATDRQVADMVYRTVRFPLTTPVPGFAIRRNAENRLALDFYHVNGLNRVTVLEDEKRLKVETSRVGLGRFLNNLHATTTNARTPDWPVRAWAWYNEFAIWSLLGMTVSGAYLWLSSRPRWRWAQAVFAAGAGSFLLLYIVTR
jgi:hypothetical protein